MGLGFPTVEVEEGRARLLVPDVPRQRGPGARGPWPFYNPTMAVSRDLSAMALARWPLRLDAVLDGLAASGAWGIRMMLEAGLPSVTFNDISESACQLVAQNLARNGLGAQVRRGTFANAVRETRFDFVDIDPFGPPARFLEALGALVPPGLGVTATDTAALSGTYPDACYRRYGARSERCAQGHEIGVRILIGFCSQIAETRGRRFRPLLSVASEHFLRVLGKTEPAVEPAESSIGSVVRPSPGRFVAAGPSSTGPVGPMWLGPVSDPEFLGHLRPTESSRAASVRLLDLLQAEAGMPAFFVTTDELASSLRRSPPKLHEFLDTLRAAGFRATRTHFDPRGVKTDAPYEEVVRMFRAAMPT